MSIRIESSWKDRLALEFEKRYFSDLISFIKKEYNTASVYPPPKQIFRAFDLVPFDSVRVVILGQDPYHGPGQAEGLSFSVPSGVRVPPSLQNIYKELQADLGVSPRTDGSLVRWANQGVLLLNATLTVRGESAGSHQGKGWEQFTDAVISRLSQEKEHLVFILWGRYAQVKGSVIDRAKHLVLESAHPSPFSATKFFGCKHFSKTNEYLIAHGKDAVVW